MYKDMINVAAAERNFKIYRVVRILHALKVINDIELCNHEDEMWRRKPVGLDINWEHYKMWTPPGDYIQF